jgi:hypothetical protein
MANSITKLSNVLNVRQKSVKYIYCIFFLRYKILVPTVSNWEIHGSMPQFPDLQNGVLWPGTFFLGSIY